MSNKHDAHSHSNEKINKLFWIKTIIIASLFFYLAFLNIFEPSNWLKYTWHWGIWFPLTTYIVFVEGIQYLKMYKKLFKGILDMDTLIGLAAHTLYLYSLVSMIINWNQPAYSYEQLWEGTGVLIIFTNIGHALEERIQTSSTEAYHKLNDLKNSDVILLKGTKEILVPVKTIKIGDIIIVKKGDIVPIDGILQSDGEFDFSNITGESKTISLIKGNEVISGAFNSGNILKLKVSKNYSESTLSTIIDKIEDVSMARPKMQKLADSILRFFIPTVLIIALLTFVSYTIIEYTTDFHWPWVKHNNSSPLIVGIEGAVTVMAIACPCALGIATPLVYTVSSLLSAKKGIMINDPKALEELSKIKIFAFDKTGTITSEKMDIVNIEGDKSLISIAKALEKNVKHPIAMSILSIPGSFAEVSNIKVNNNFISGIWKGKNVKIGRYNSENITTDIALFIESKPKLIIKMNNSIKPEVKKTISELKKRGIKTVMITGDHDLVAKDIAKKVGIDHVYSNQSPIDKLETIKKLQQQGKVLFVGDGFNDSVSMKQANISVAFASGSEITNILSDISILRNDFHSIIDLLVISRMNNFSVKTSLFYAFAFNSITIPVAVLLLVQPWVGATIMAISDILVALNAYLYKKRGMKKLNIKNNKLHSNIIDKKYA